MASPWLRRIALAAPFVAAALVCVPVLGGGFVYDDPHAIVHNPVVTGAVGWTETFHRDFWGTPIADGVRSYRPLLPLVWRTLFAAWPGRALPFRLLTLLLHLAATLLVWLTARELLSRRIAWMTTLLFAVHPVHAEAIGSIVAQADLLSTALGLAALLVTVRRRPRAHLAAAALVALACAAKESAVVFGVLVALVIALSDERRRTRLWRLLPTAVVALATIAVQLSLPRSADVRSGVVNLALVAGPGGRALHGLYVIGRGLAMCFLPTGLAPQHAYAAIDLAPATLLPYAIPGALLLVVGIGAFVLALARRHPRALIAVGLLVGPVVLQSSLLFVVVNELAERLLYPASVASCALLAVALARLHLRAAPVLAAVVAVAFASGSVWVERAWRSDAALWTYAIGVEPRALASQNGYGTALLRDGHITQAMWHRMIEQYIDERYPAPIDWTPIDRAETEPDDLRVLDGPGLLAPDRPCAFAAAWLRAITPEVPDFVAWIAPQLDARYGCSRR